MVAINESEAEDMGSSKKILRGGLKTKALILTEDDHPLSLFMKEVRGRGIKDFDIAEFIADALEAVPQEWWDKQLGDMTPLEYRIQIAMNDPSMREKLSAILAENGHGAPTLSH